MKSWLSGTPLNGVPVGPLTAGTKPAAVTVPTAWPAVSRTLVFTKLNIDWLRSLKSLLNEWSTVAISEMTSWLVASSLKPYSVLRGTLSGKPFSGGTP